MNWRAPVEPRLLLTGLGLVVGIAGLALQFYLSVGASLANGRDLPGTLGSFFSYYTILTNIVLVLIYLSSLTNAAFLKIFRHPVARGLMAANIALVMLYVYFVLRFLFEMEGPAQIADRFLHYLAPCLYLLWWLFAQRHGALRLAHIPLMLAPTLAYFAYILLRGAWVVEYPYPILEVNKIGYGAVLLNALYMSLAFAALSALVVAIDAFLARQSRKLQS